MFDIGVGHDFMDMTPKTKTKKVGPHQTKKILPSERNNQQSEVIQLSLILKYSL